MDRVRTATKSQQHCLRPASEIKEDGIYLHKRPVKSAGGQADVLRQAGTVFYHVVVYIKTGDQVGGHTLDVPLD